MNTDTQLDARGINRRTLARHLRDESWDDAVVDTLTREWIDLDELDGLDPTVLRILRDELVAFAPRLGTIGGRALIEVAGGIDALAVEVEARALDERTGRVADYRGQVA